MTLSPPTLDLMLSELLSLHLLERELMQDQKHAEHQQCVARKLYLANDIDALMANGTKLSPLQTKQLVSIRTAAQVNAQIAEKMLLMAKEKMDLIRKICAPSYGSDGQVSQPNGSGGLLDLKA
jgi:hypothetical protein